MHVFALASLSLDGFIAPSPEAAQALAANVTSSSWTSKEDLRFFIDRTKQAGLVVMGATTFATLPTKPQPGKINIIMSHRTPEQLLERGWKTKSGESVQCVALAEELAELDQQHAYVCDWTPQRLVTWLEQRGFPELAVCGGASVYQQFLQAGVVETLYLTVEPIVFGSGVSFTMGLSAPLRWQLISKRALNENTLLLEYQRAD